MSLSDLLLDQTDKGRQGREEQTKIVSETMHLNENVTLKYYEAEQAQSIMMQGRIATQCSHTHTQTCHLLLTTTSSMCSLSHTHTHTIYNRPVSHSINSCNAAHSASKQQNPQASAGRRSSMQVK